MADIADALGCSVRTVQRLVARDRLKPGVLKDVVRVAVERRKQSGIRLR